MKLTVDTLVAQVQKELLPLYILSGDEPLLEMETIDCIVKTARKSGFEECISWNVDDAGFSWSDFLLEANSLSFFSKKRIFVIRLPAAKARQASTALQYYAKQLPEDTLLILILGKTDAKVTSASWFRALEQRGAWVQIWPVSLFKMPAWLSRRLEKARLSLTQEARNFFLTQVEGNLLAAAQVIEKLQYANLPMPIDEKALQPILANGSFYTVFELAERALQGKSAICLKMSRRMQAEGQEPILVLWVLAQSIRILSEFAHGLRKRMGVEDVIKKIHETEKIPLAIVKKKVALYQTSLGRHSQRGLRDLLLIASNIDRVIKGAQTGSHWDLLDRLLVGLAGTSEDALCEKPSDALINIAGVQAIK